VSIEVKEGLLPSLLKGETAEGHRSYIKSYNDFSFEERVENCVSFSMSYYSSHLELSSVGGIKLKFS